MIYPRVTVILVTFNSEKFIHKCIESILKQDYKNLELIIVDNGSKDNTLKIISEFDKIRLIKNKLNLGVCYARNQVLKIIDSKYVLTLDSDVILNKDFISKMVAVAEKSPGNIGMWGGRVMDMKHPHRIDTLGIVLTKFYRFYDCGQGKVGEKFKPDISKIIGPCACAAMYKMEMLRDIKQSRDEYFDSQMHYLIEDFDLALRAKARAWKFKYVPDAIGYHYRHGSKIAPKYIQYLSFRNRYYLILKHFKFNNLPFLFLSFLFYDLPRLIFLLSTNWNYTRMALEEIKNYELEKSRNRG